MKTQTAELVETIRLAYDEKPYQSFAFAQTAPEHLATVAWLFGLDAPDPAHARVLELGCAAGGNIIPFAMRHPNAHVTGIDLSPMQIAAGRQLVGKLDLDNVDLLEANFADVADSLGEFDYIICHGVYSWVPPEVQQAILKIARDKLAPDGIAYVSYNCYPGWKAKEVVRDAMILRGRTPEAENNPLGYARGLIDFLHGAADPESLFGRIMAEFQPAIEQGRDDYLHHEFLEPCNAPCYFGDFVARAKAFGLAYLADATAPMMFASNYGTKVAEPLIRECGDSQVKLEQYLDFVVNRTFRQTLLVHQVRAQSIRYRLDAERLRRFHVAAQLPPQSEHDALDDTPQPYGMAGADFLMLASPAVKAAARVLTCAWPATRDFASLVAAAKDAVPDMSMDEIENEIVVLIEFLIIQGRARYRIEPVECAIKDDGVLPDLSRRHAAATGEAGDAWLANAWHEPVILDSVDRCLILDAPYEMQDELAMAARLVEAVEDGRLGFQRGETVVTGGVAIAECAAEHAARFVGSFGQRFFV